VFIYLVSSSITLNTPQKRKWPFLLTYAPCSSFIQAQPRTALTRAKPNAFRLFWKAVWTLPQNSQGSAQSGGDRAEAVACRCQCHHGATGPPPPTYLRSNDATCAGARVCAQNVAAWCRPEKWCLRCASPRLASAWQLTTTREWLPDGTWSTALASRHHN